MIFKTAFAQESTADPVETFKGVIVDDNNTPVKDVIVSVQEKNERAQTNSKGEFSISATLSDVLIFKKSGFYNVQKTLSSKDLISITLKTALVDAGEEDDVYIPFGVRKKRQISAAVTSFKSEGIPQTPVADLKNLYAGRISGLLLQQTNTAPGNDGTNFLIRSINSFGANNAKAFVDGVQREFGDMDLNEVESITVLKDAASLAWYGLRGGNGVVLVNTKRGNPGNSYLRLDAQTGFQTPVNIIKPLDSYNNFRIIDGAGNGKIPEVG